MKMFATYAKAKLNTEIVKRLRLGGSQAYDRSSVLNCRYIHRWHIRIRHNLLYKAWADRPDILYIKDEKS